MILDGEGDLEVKGNLYREPVIFGASPGDGGVARGRHQRMRLLRRSQSGEPDADEQHRIGVPFQLWKPGVDEQHSHADESRVYGHLERRVRYDDADERYRIGKSCYGDPRPRDVDTDGQHRIGEAAIYPPGVMKH